MLRANAGVKKANADSRTASRRRRIWRISRRAALLTTLAAIVLLCPGDYRPSDLDRAVAPYRFSIVGWELRNLPGKWLPRAAANPSVIRQYFAAVQRQREIARRIIALEAERPEAQSPRTGAIEQELADLAAEQTQLRNAQSRQRPGVEKALETAVADALRSLGFGTAAGIFPPVDTVLTGSPTVLVISPRDRIVRQDAVILHTGLPAAARTQLEQRVESDPALSALVVNTGGIAFYPSITVPAAGLDFALEIIAHEWTHHWLWFRPLGRRYFAGGDLTAINETVADIAGKEISILARQNLDGYERPANPASAAAADAEQPNAVAPAPAVAPPRFDFHTEMRVTRERVDDLLDAGAIAAAEDYMERRRREFVANGYYIRRLNQAYFAFHGAYATTGAAGVNIIGQQVAELRQRSPSLAAFLRTAAQFTGPQDLADYLAQPSP